MAIYSITEAERLILTILQGFSCMDERQIKTILMKTGRSEEGIKKALFGLAYQHQIYEVKWSKATYYSLTPKTVSDVHAYVDAIWVLLEHIDDDEDYLDILRHIIIPKKPALLCYTKGENIYYILKVYEESDLQNMYLLEERIYGSASEKIYGHIKVMVMLRDEELIPDFPKVEYDYVKVHVVSNTEKMAPEVIVY